MKAVLKGFHEWLLSARRAPGEQIPARVVKKAISSIGFTLADFSSVQFWASDCRDPLVVLGINMLGINAGWQWTAPLKFLVCANAECLFRCFVRSDRGRFVVPLGLGSESAFRLWSDYAVVVPELGML
jgi:hypothetical protein